MMASVIARGPTNIREVNADATGSPAVSQGLPGPGSALSE